MLSAKLTNGVAEITITADLTAWENQLRADVVNNIRTANEARNKLREMVLVAAEDELRAARNAVALDPNVEREKLEARLTDLATKRPTFDASVKV